MKRKNIPFIILFLFSLTAYKVCLLYGRECTLVAPDILKEEEREEVLQVKVKEGSTLSLAFIHSLYHTPQIEIYTVLAESLFLREIHFGNLEAAGYYDPNPRGDLYLEGNLWKLKLSYPIPFQAVRMRIPYTGPLRLTIDGSTPWVSQEKDRGALLIIKPLFHESRGRAGAER
jgi:hypothetical protein